MKSTDCASACLIRKFIDPKATFQFAPQKPWRRTEVTFDMLDADFTHQGDSCTFETLCVRFAMSDPIISQIAEMVHDPDLEGEEFDREEAFGIDLMVKGLAHMEKSSDEILAVGISAVEALFHALKSRYSRTRDRPISPPRSVLMPVMNVGVMRVGMSQPRVSVPMGMRHGRRIARRVLMLVVLVVVVEMCVFQRLMDVLMFVSLGDVQPDAD